MSIAEQLHAVRQRIAQAAAQHGRAPDTIELLAVSKTFSADAIRDAYAAGQHAFGESYVQEAVDKISTLADLPELVCWHFIGPLQSNKTRQVAAHFDWVHAIDRLKIAERLSEQRPVGLPPLQVCVQVNISGEASKSGVEPDQVAALAHAVAALPNLRLRGLMAIPAPCDDPAQARAPFARLAALAQALRADGLDIDTLSMGMSDDLDAAIAEGATLVRVGTAIFGSRTYATPV
ncbi:YggS family pyridoxal phosphate-dependent enzyme [Pigmentiphaga aceris]|uniref:Pyridoxal phosphate homeostasis protein n=1 Tax=Pigmentiphaga aceris TaxID=1940612 RepID=A0A5C0AVM1_9BURK|nr:YggS family pyridoxal phosphate-dependent enzyme [Pigmentiphaga aceris]QEI05403.1 YggS family pyridoxal phosphate-dependent enzyme [Pigmentiphaga aceris]